MSCACEFDSSGMVVGICSAHAEYNRKAFRGLCEKEEHHNHEQLVRDLAYQKKRADFFERLLVEGGKGA